MSGGAKPSIRKVKAGKDIVTQGEDGDELFLLLNGVVTVLVDDEAVAELGPGAVLGERAVLEGGVRTASLQASTDVRVTVAPADRVDRDTLVRLREHHRRE